MILFLWWTKEKYWLHHHKDFQLTHTTSQILPKNVWAILNIFKLVQFELWNKEKFYFAIAFVWFKNSLV